MWQEYYAYGVTMKTAESKESNPSSSCDMQRGSVRMSICPSCGRLLDSAMRAVLEWQQHVGMRATALLRSPCALPEDSSAVCTRGIQAIALPL